MTALANACQWCGEVLYLVGHGSNKRTAIFVCERCDCAELMPIVKELRGT